MSGDHGFTTDFRPNDIPHELRQLDQWVCWRPILRDGKVTKVPVRVDGSPARSDFPASWATFAEVVSAGRKHGWGVGFVFSATDPYVGVDLDGVIEGRGVCDWAAELLDDLCSYTEVTPSGSGVHVIVKGTLPAGRRRTGGIEMYDRGRFFTMTGRHLWGTPWGIRQRRAELRDLHQRLFPPQPSKVGHSGPALPGYLPDEELIKKAGKAANGPKFLRLMAGDIVGYNSHSEADAALASILGFWTDDVEQIARIIGQSGLAREKWERRPRYREQTIARGQDRETRYRGR